MKNTVGSANISTQDPKLYQTSIIKICILTHLKIDPIIGQLAQLILIHRRLHQLHLLMYAFIIVFIEFINVNF